MFVVFSEMNCLKSLNDLGVYPDEFYTDFEALKNRAVYFKEAFVLFIFAGGSEFSRKHILDYVDHIRGRAESASDIGVTGYAILSDTILPSVNDYYKYSRYFDVVYKASRYKTEKQKLDIWGNLKSEQKKSACYMSMYDMGNIEGTVEQFNNRYRADDVYIEKIVVPKIRESLS